MSTQENELLLDSFLVKKGLLETVNPTIGPPRPTIDQSLNQSLDSFLKYKGYEIVGELPERPPAPTPEMKAYVEKEFRPGRAEAFTQLPGKPEDSYPTISTNILGATPGFWKQAKDLATAWATGKINQTDIIGRDFFKGLTGGNIDPYDIVEKISGKPGFKEFAETVNRAKVRVAVGYEPREAMAFAGGAAESAGQMALLVPILKGAGIAAKVLPKIPMLRAVARGVVTGVLSGAIQKPEQEGLENRLKQIPPNVLFFTAFETLGVTAEQMLKIFRWNKEWRGYKPGAKIEPISKVIPGEAQEFTADEMKNLFRKMDANSSNTGGAWSVLTDREQNVVNTVAKSPGWKQAVREGFISEAVPETIPGLKVSPELIPRKPRMGDVFKNIEKLPKYEQFGYFKEYPEEVWPKGKVPPEAPGTAEPPPPVGGPGMAPKAAPARPEPQPGPIAGEIPSLERPPRVILDISPKPGGKGWTYTFTPGIVEEVPESALKALSSDIINQLPPHVQEIIKTKMPRTWSPRKARTFKDPLVDAIYKLGGISPDSAFPMEVLKDLGLPPGLINKSGFHLDVLARTLVHDYPELDTPRAPQDQALYNLLFQRVIRARHGRATGGEGEGPQTAEEVMSGIEDYYAELWGKGTLDRENLSEDEARLIQELKDKKLISDEDYGKYKSAARVGPGGETLGEFEGPGYQGADKEALKENYRKWLESRGTAPEVIKKQLALFGGEFAPSEEPVTAPKPKAIPEPMLIEIPKRDKSIFDSRGLGTFKDINVWRKQVQPFVEQGYVVEYGHEAGAKGWAKLVEKKKPGEGKLISRARPAEGLPKPPTEMEGILEYERRFREDRRVGPTLSKEELVKITDYERRFGERRRAVPEKPAEIIKPEVKKEPAFDLRRQLATALQKMNVPRKKWGEVTKRVLKNYNPEEGELEDYVRKIAFGRAPTGVPILTEEGEPWPHKEKPKEISLEEIPEPTEKEPAYDRFEKREQEARIRDIVTKEAHDDVDLDVLESRIFSDPPESLETIGTRHGISRQAIDKRWQALIEKLKQNPDLLEILNKKYELHSFPGIVSKKNIEDLRDLINKYFSSSKGVSKEVDMVNDERVGGILAEKFGATVEAKKLDKYIKEQGSNPAVLQYFKDLLEGGNIQGAPLPADIKQNLLSMRQRIDRLSDMIIAHGGVPEKTKAVFEDNIGKYLGKFYRIYEMIGRAKGKMIKRYWDPPQPVRDRFKNALKQQFPQTFGTYSNEELDNFLEGMVRKADLYARGAKRTKRIPPEHYIHRIKLTPEYREFAGEILDPRYLYLKTVSEQAVMGYNSKMLKLVKDQYPDLWTKDLDKARRLGWQKSQLPEDWHAYGEMAGLYIDPELGEYLRNEFFPSRSGMEHMIEKWIINPFKWTKTIGSVPTHARNFLGNPMFSMLMRNSIWNPANARFYVKAAQIIVGRGGKYAKEWEDLVRHGVTETQFWGAEIPRFYEELLRIDPADWPEKLFDAAVKRPINKLSNLYNAEDAVYRISSHLKNIEHFHMTPMQSVEEINLGMTNYRKLPTAVEILRRYPVLGPFISFKANVAKILYNQAKQAAKDMGSKPTRSKGIRRGFVLASALALPIILQEVSKKVFHIDSEDQKIIEKYMPEWRRHGIYFYWRNKKGTAKVFDFTYIYPAGDIQKAARAALAGDIGSFKDAINLFAHPVLDLYSILMQDRDPTWGTKLPGGFKEQVAKALTQIWLPASAPIPSLKALVHGEIRAGSLTPYQVKTLIDSWYGEAPIGREPKKFTEELKNFLTGVRTFDLNPEQIMKTYLRSKRLELTESMNEYRAWLKQNPGARDHEVNDKLKALQAKQKKISEALKQASADIIKLKRGGFALEPEKQ